MKNFSINMLSFIYIIFLLFIILSDYFVFFLNVSQIISYIISAALLFIIYIFIRKNIKIVLNKFNVVDILIFLFLTSIFILRIAIPDSSFDTLNYHLYIQENAFADNVNYNFFPARWINTFSFPLADRVHYFFRTFLGYRLGLIFNFITMLVIYFQVKELLRKIIGNDNLVSFLSALVIITEQILTNMITYYVDLLAIPIFLEIMLIVLSSKQESEVTNVQNYFVLLLAGIAVSLKVSNVFIIIPFAIIYIFRYWKSFNYKTFLFGIPLVLFPVFVYILNNYLQTGNPFFPFYNSIFKSDYLNLDNWMETFYGPKSIIERLFWPIYVIFNPRRAHDTDVYYGRIGFGFIIAIVVLILFFKNAIFSKNRKLSILEIYSLFFIAMCLVWQNFMMGYIRYALVLDVLAGVILVLFIYKYFNKNIIFSSVVFCMICYTFFNSVGDMYKTSYELSWRLPYSKDTISYKRNLNYLFNRKWDYSSYLEDIDCLAVSDYNSGYAVLLNSDLPIIGLNESFQNEYAFIKLNKMLNKCDNIYSVTTTFTYDRNKDYLENLGYIIVGSERKFKADFLNIDNDIVLVKIKKIKEK